MNEVRKPGKQLERATFRTSRLLDFCSEKELIAQTGHRPEAWPLVVLKELVDNALDACEEARIAPEITVKVDDTGITVSDNGPGIPPETVAAVLDFSLRVSSREAYVAPDRGAQGNALKTIVAMPFVLDGESGRVEVATATGRHRITFGVNAIRQEPVISHDHAPEEHLEIGTEITVVWPVSACSILTDAKDRFLQFASDYTWINPHLTLHTDWFGEAKTADATDAGWAKWGPSDTDTRTAEEARAPALKRKEKREKRKTRMVCPSDFRSRFALVRCSDGQREVSMARSHLFLFSLFSFRLHYA